MAQPNTAVSLKLVDTFQARRAERNRRTSEAMKLSWKRRRFGHASPVIEWVASALMTPTLIWPELPAWPELPEPAAEGA